MVISIYLGVAGTRDQFLRNRARPAAEYLFYFFLKSQNSIRDDDMRAQANLGGSSRDEARFAVVAREVEKSTSIKFTVGVKKCFVFTKIEYLDVL